MKIDELVFDKSIYPRFRHLGLDSEIKLNAENVEDIRETIRIEKKPRQVIRYNKRTMNIIDGTHTWQALREEGWKDIPEKYLEVLDIPVEEEIIYAVHYNISHGLKLTDNEAKAVLANMLDEKGKLKYGNIENIAKLWGKELTTIKSWLATIRKGPTQGKSAESADSTTNGDLGTDPTEDLQQTKKELEKTKIKLDEANKRIDEFEIKWNTVCPTHKRAISMCKDCGK